MEQGGPETLRRDEALMALATLSIQDTEFLTGLQTDMENTLWRYGFALSPQEMEEVRGYFASAARNDPPFDETSIVEDLRAQLDPTVEYRIWRFN